MQEIEKLIETAVKGYDITDAAIGAMSNAYMTLTIAGQDDKKGYSAVREARITVKGKRVEVEKKRKELKEDSLRFGRAVDTEAKRIMGMLEPIEDYLSKQEDDYDAEKDRIKQEAIEKEQERIQARADRLHEYGGSVNIASLQAMTDDDFAVLLETVKTEYNTEQERQAAEMEAEKARLDAEKTRQAELDRSREEELKRIAEVAAEQTRERAKLEAERRVAEELQRKAEEAIRVEREAIEAEKQRIADERIAAENERQRLIELEEAKRIAAENAKREAVLEMERAEAARIEAERLAKAEAEREALLKPDIEKLQAWGREIEIIATHRPDVKDAELKDIVARITELLSRAVRIAQKGGIIAKL